jgi:enterochelin esterase family protein
MDRPVNIQAPRSASADGTLFDPFAQHPALAALLRAGTPTDEAVAGFVAALAFPLVEPGAATFAWRGDAERVDLLRWIHAGVDRKSFQRVPGTGLWVLRIAVEDGGRFEYKLGIARAGYEDWVLDPLNANRAGDPFGENSVCRTWGYKRPDWSGPRGAPAGRIEDISIDSPTFGETRTEQIYLPAGYCTDAVYPLVVIHDGADFVTYADLSISLDNLIAEGDIPPIIAALVQTGDRMGEYPKGRRHARYLVNELLPAIAGSHSISSQPRDRVLLGASLGAVASLSTAFRYPGVYGALVLKSGSFILDQSKLAHRAHPVFHHVARLVRAFQRTQHLPVARAFVSTGELEGLADENRALAKFLQDRGVDVLFQSAWDGHHWHNWRDQLRDGLMWVLRPDQN